MDKKTFKLTPRCSRTGAMLYFTIAAAIVALDQLSKASVAANIPLGASVPALAPIFQLTHIRNTGAAWSILSNHTAVLSAVSVLATAGICVYGICGRLCPAARIALFVIAGGAAGNLIDRIRLGYVVDMIDLLFMDYPVFNVADCFIVTGGIVFVLVFSIWNEKYLLNHDLLDITAPAEETGNDDEADS